MLTVGGAATAAAARPDPRLWSCPPASLFESAEAPATTETSEIVVPDDSRLFGDRGGTVLAAPAAACASR